MPGRRSGCLATIAIGCVPFVAAAQQAPPIVSPDAPPTQAHAPAPDELPPTPTKRFYGMPTLVSDLASIPLMALGLGIAGSVRSDDIDARSGAGVVLFGVGAIGYLGVGPVVHLVNRHVGRAFGTAGLRVGIPLAAGFLVAGPGSRPPDWVPPVALIFGAVVASAIDLLFFTYELEPDQLEAP